MRLLSRAAVIVFAFGAVASGSAHAATDPTATVKDFYAALTQAMQRGPQLGEKGRYDALAPAIRQNFDLSAMAQLAIGPSWAQLSPTERQQVTEAFARYTIATYANEFSKDGGVKFEVADRRAMPYGTVVDTKIVQPDGGKVAINYLMRQNGQQWQISDVYLQGTISQVANLRSQFSAVFSRGGANGLSHERGGIWYVVVGVCRWIGERLDCTSVALRTFAGRPRAVLHRRHLGHTGGCTRLRAIHRCGDGHTASRRGGGTIFIKPATAEPSSESRPLTQHRRLQGRLGSNRG